MTIRSILAACAMALASAACAGADPPPPGGTMLVASDLHFDPTADGALVDALSASGPGEWERILAPDAGAAFTRHGADPAWALIRSALDAMQEAVPKPDLVILPGDFLAHDFRNKFNKVATDRSDAAFDRFVESTIAFLGLELQQRFPGTPILPTLGNNDDECGDYEIDPDGPFLAGTAAIVRGLARVDGDFDRSWRALGVYEAPAPGLRRTRILFLNSVFLSTHYKDACGAAKGDPGAAMLDWLEGRLAAAEAAHETAWLVYHIPPGIDAFATARAGASACRTNVRSMWQPALEARFEALMARYAATVAASLAGHTHMDEFRLVTSGGKAVAFAFGTPGISPIFGQNPGFRVVRFTADGGLADAETYFLANLTAAGGATAADWRREYGFDQAYGLPAIGLPGLERLAQEIAADPAIRDRWEGYYSVSRPERSGGITPASFRAYSCAIGHSDTAGFAACYCDGAE